jgi:hypothetical protein
MNTMMRKHVTAAMIAMLGAVERRSSCQLSLPLSLCCSVFAASLLHHALNNQTVASSVGINNKLAPKIIPGRRVRLNTTYA